MPTLKNPFKQTLTLIALCGIFACSETPPDKPEPIVQEPEAPIPPQALKKDSNLTKPLVYIEELDQFQDYYKEQHTTSFSHVRNKNWFSFRAGKEGLLTKILLYGKPTVRITAYYGNSMSGFIREGNPSTGPKYGAWQLSRDDILDQLAAQSLTENDSGWITIQMLGEIPQEIGKTYFLVCEKIEEKSWFGDFAFGEGNPTRTEEFGLILITILFSAPMWAEHYPTAMTPKICPNRNNPVLNKPMRLRLPFQFPSSPFLPKKGPYLNNLNPLPKNQSSQTTFLMNQHPPPLPRFLPN